MLSQFRVVAQSPIAKVLMAVVAFSFVVWGIRDVFRGADLGDVVVRAGGRTEDSAHFRRMVEQRLQQYGQQTGQPITMQDVLSHNLDRQLADGLAAEDAFDAYLARIGIRPSDELVAKALHQFTAFFDPVSGRFDRNTYLRLLRQTNLTPKEFETQLGDEIAQNQLGIGMVAGLRAPVIYAAIPAAATADGRTFSWFTVGPQAAGAIAPPSDTQLTAFMNENAAALRRPETRILTLVHVSAAQLAPTLPVDTAAVQKRYDLEKATMNQPEKRTLVEIPLRDPKTGPAAAQRLRNGEDPAAVARSLGVQPVVYTDAPKTAIADRKVADTAFSMAAGQSIGPIQGDLGSALVKMMKIAAGHAVTFEEARPRLEAEVRKAAADEKITSVVQKFEDSHSGGANLAASAKAAGLGLTTLPPVTAQGTDAQGHPLPIPPKVLKSAFGLQAGADSELEDAGNGEYFAVRVEKVLPPALPALAEIRPLLVQAWMQVQQGQRMRAKADQLADQVRKGQSLQTAAASVGAQLQHAVDVRPTAAAAQVFDRDLLGRLFSSHKPGDVMVGKDLKAGVDVAQLQAAVPGSATEIANGVPAQRQQATSGLLNDLGQAVHKAAAAVVKPKVDYKRARAALGGGQAAQ